MSIIKNITDVTPFVNVDQDLNIDSINPDIEQHEQSTFKKLLGDTLYADIDTKYNATTPNLTDPEKELLRLGQKVVVNLAMSDAIDSLPLSINDNTITVGESNREKQPYRYQKEDFRKVLIRRALSSIEDLLKFLEENTAVFQSWSDSEYSNSTRSYLINSALEFQHFEDIKSNRITFAALKPLMNDVENISLNDILSADYLAEIKEAVQAETETEEHKKLLATFIRPALAKLVIADACSSLAVEINGQGILVNQLKQEGKEQLTASQTLINSKRVFAERKGKYYLNKLREFLNENASGSAYATYFTSANYTAPPVENEPLVNRNIYRS